MKNEKKHSDLIYLGEIVDNYYALHPEDLTYRVSQHTVEIIKGLVKLLPDTNKEYQKQNTDKRNKLITDLTSRITKRFDLK